jgi:hypothetical protein
MAQATLREIPMGNLAFAKPQAEGGYPSGVQQRLRSSRGNYLCHGRRPVRAQRMVEASAVATPYELGLRVYPVYFRGQAFPARQGTQAAVEFQKILDNPGLVWNEPIGALAHLGLGRGYATEIPSPKSESSASRILRHSGITVAFKPTFEVFSRVGPDNSLERLTERSVGLVTDQPSDVYELFVTLL